MMKRVLSVIALGVALSLSTMGFKDAEVETGCEETQDLTITANLEEMEEGMSEINGRIVNQSTDRDYDEVMVLVEFHGAEMEAEDLGEMETEVPDDMEEAREDMEETREDMEEAREEDLETDIDRERDLDADMDEGDVDIEYKSEPEMDTDIDETSPESRTGSLGSRVFTINEDVEAGEVEEFTLDVTPPAGTTSITTSVVCADED